MAFVKLILARFWALWVVCCFITTAFLVWLILVLFNHYKEPKRTRFFQLLSRVWIQTYFFLVGVRLSIYGKEVFQNIPKAIVVCNHRSFVDILIMTPFMPHVNKTIGKNIFMKIPLFRRIYGSATVLLDRSGVSSKAQSILEMKRVLAEGFSLCIYAEGTRNKTSFPLMRFQNGAFLLATLSGVPIIPAVLIHTDRALSTKRLFYAWPAHIKLYFLPPVVPEHQEAIEELNKRVHSLMQSAYLTHLNPTGKSA